MPWRAGRLFRGLRACSLASGRGSAMHERKHDPTQLAKHPEPARGTRQTNLAPCTERSPHTLVRTRTSRSYQPLVLTSLYGKPDPLVAAAGAADLSTTVPLARLGALATPPTPPPPGPQKIKQSSSSSKKAVPYQLVKVSSSMPRCHGFEMGGSCTRAVQQGGQEGV